MVLTEPPHWAGSRRETAPIVGLPKLWSHQKNVFSLDVVGLAQCWAAPVARLDAPNGIAEDSWMEMAETIVAVRLCGS